MSVLVLGAVGCSTKVVMPELTLAHPAHPEAAAGAASGTPPTLIVPNEPVARPMLPVPSQHAPDHPTIGNQLHITKQETLTHTHQSPTSTARMHPDPAKSPKAGDRGVVVACPIHPQIFGDPGGQCTVCGLPVLPRRLTHMEMDGMDHDMHAEDPSHAGHEMPSQRQMPDDRQMAPKPHADEGHEIHSAEPAETPATQDTEAEANDAHH
jgi:hypothetical protein